MQSNSQASAQTGSSGAVIVVLGTGGTIAGSGDVKVMASATLTASIAGSGDVIYRGQPRVTRAINGSGSIRPAR